MKTSSKNIGRLKNFKRKKTFLFFTPISNVQKPCDFKYTSLKLEAKRRFLPWKLKIRPAYTYVGVGLRMNERFGCFRKRSTISGAQGHRRREADPFPRGSMGARITTPKFGLLGLSAFSMSSDSCRPWLWISRVYYHMPWHLTVRSRWLKLWFAPTNSVVLLSARRLYSKYVSNKLCFCFVFYCWCNSIPMEPLGDSLLSNDNVYLIEFSFSVTWVDVFFYSCNI